MMSPEEITKRREAYNALCEKRMRLIESSVSASNSGDKELAKKYYDEMMALDPEYCEHDRSWASNCSACDAIHMECFPEYFGKCMSCEEFVDKDELRNDKCIDCFGEDDIE